MTIEVALLISIISVSFGVYSGVVSQKRNDRQDSKKDATDMTTVIVKLENIGTGITEIKTEMNNVKSEQRYSRDRIIECEQSIKSAWKRIDIIEGTKSESNEQKI